LSIDNSKKCFCQQKNTFSALKKNFLPKPEFGDGSSKSNLLVNLKAMNMNVEKGAEQPNVNKIETKRRRGRPKKGAILKYRYTIRLNNADSKRLLEMYKQSGAKSLSRFMADCVLNHKIKIIEINKSAIDFVMLLSQFFVQFRGIKNNYNQLFAVLVRNLDEDKARFMLKIIENPTLDFIQTMKEIEQITTKLKDKCLPK
jgi:hypothetical protein